MATTVDELRLKVATSCRILGMMGMVRESTGHVSARIPGTDEMWIRCRGGQELGVAFTGIHNVRRADFDGQGPHVGDGHGSPSETPIHGEIYRAHPEVNAVVHAHPWYALLCGVTNLEFRPVFGGFDPSALKIVLEGVPVFPRAATVTNKQLAAELLACMGDRDVVLMKGHGITVTGRSLEQATSQAIRFDRLAQIMWELATSGRQADDISPEDMARYNRQGRAERSRTGWREVVEGAENFAWNHYVKLLQVNNIGPPDDLDAD
jgi:ribulose-5-phosphate 4-epimerase/fuculose-1-phosphate aldolase